MARPRKYATDAERIAARREQNRMAQQAKRAPTHAMKIDPSKRSDAHVNSKAYPTAPINDATMKAINEIMEEAGELTFTGIPARGIDRDAAALRLIDWEENNRMRLPNLPDDGVLAVGRFGIDALSLAGRWNKLLGPLRYWAHIVLPRKDRRLRRLNTEQARAEEAGATVSEMRQREDELKQRRWKNDTANRITRERSSNALAARARREEREDKARVAAMPGFGRF